MSSRTLQNTLAVAIVLGAVGFVVWSNIRSLALAEQSKAAGELAARDPGAALQLRALHDTGAGTLPFGSVAVLFVRSSQCESCAFAAPWWHEVADSLGLGATRLYSVHLGRVAAQHLADARPEITDAVPVNPDAFLRAARLRGIPATLVVVDGRIIDLQLSGTPGRSGVQHVLDRVRRGRRDRPSIPTTE